MRQVDVYEISKTVRTMEGSYMEIPMNELHGLSGRAWGNPGGGETFIRYSAPVTHVRESWIEDGFTHRRDYYVAISPRLLELLAPAVDATLSAQLREKTRKVEALLKDVDALNEAHMIERGINARVSAELQNLRDEVWNFRCSNVLTRIWRAIRQRLV